MTGSDPAVAAAERGIVAAHPGVVVHDEGQERIALAAAREALAPLRELHKPHTEPGWEDEPFCMTCARGWHNTYHLTHQPWPCATAQLIYSIEELS